MVHRTFTMPLLLLIVAGMLVLVAAGYGWWGHLEVALACVGSAALAVIGALILRLADPLREEDSRRAMEELQRAADEGRLPDEVAEQLRKR